MVTKYITNPNTKEIIGEEHILEKGDFLNVVIDGEEYKGQLVAIENPCVVVNGVAHSGTIGKSSGGKCYLYDNNHKKTIWFADTDIKVWSFTFKYAIYSEPNHIIRHNANGDTKYYILEKDAVDDYNAFAKSHRTKAEFINKISNGEAIVEHKEMYRNRYRFIYKEYIDGNLVAEESAVLS